VADPAYRDVLWGFTASGIFRQFGPELVRAAAALPGLPAELLPALRETVLVHAANILGEPDPAVRGGLAGLLGRYGRGAFGLYDLLNPGREPDPLVAAAARKARAAIRRDVPPLTFWRARARRAVGRVMRAVDRFAHPLHHYRLQRIEHLLAELLEVQKRQLDQADLLLRLQLGAAKAGHRAGPADDRAGPRAAA
jgi:hypothetical protein